MRAAVYTRISLDRSGKRAGVERQRADCEGLCAAQGWQVAEYFEDNDRSAYSGRERPAYGRLVEAVVSGEVDAVVAWHQDRLWRNVIEQQTFLAFGREAGLKLVTTPSGSFDPADADDEFVSTIQAAVSKRESAATARRMRRRQLEKAEHGEFHGGGRAFGHTKDRKRLVKREAALIRDAARRILAGESGSSIVRDWQDRGVKTVRGGRWRLDTISALLAQPRLAGLREHRGKVMGEATWPAIIDRETHERLRAMFDRRRNGPASRPARWLLSGLLRCSKCGASLTAQKQNTRGGTPRYACPPRTVGGCAGVTVRAELVETEATRLVLDYLDSQDFARALARVQQRTGDRDLGDLAERLTRDRARLAELGDMLADSEIDPAEYRRLCDRVESRIDAAESRLAAAADTGPGLRYAGQGQALHEGWEELTLEERRTIIGAVVEHFVIEPATQPRNIWRPERVRAVWRFDDQPTPA
jgi:site-specific DNA recombinase